MYHSWSREDLIKRIQDLSRQVENTYPPLKKFKPSGKEIKMSEYVCKRVALRIFYRGTNYQGFASQSPNPHSSISSLVMNTVEDHLFKAIYTCRLGTMGGLQWSRAGRTDAGVHGVGQVVSAWLRVTAKKTSTEPDVDFGRVLNPQLPEDIRVTGWAILEDDQFDARFRCTWRQYKYFFSPHGLDLQAMQAGCDRLVGEHDFRNFCRKDPSKEITNFSRRILECRIEVVDDRTAALVIKGTAFLYNQVRCTMSILLRIGKGVEQVSIVDYLLDVQACPKRPLYPIASEAFLVFHKCEYEPPLQFQECPHHTISVFEQEAARANALLQLNLMGLQSVSNTAMSHPEPLVNGSITTLPTER